MKLKEIVDEYPTKYSLEYKKFPRYHRLERIDIIIKDLMNNPEFFVDDSSLLDVGCSDGLFLHIAKKYFPKKRFYGIDNYKKEMLDYAKKLNPRIEFKFANAKDLPFDDQSFDVVCCFETLEHIENRIEAIKEIERVLKPGGFIYISVPVERGIIGSLKRTARFILQREDSHKGFDENELIRYLYSNEHHFDYIEVQNTIFKISKIIKLKKVDKRWKKD